MNKLTWMLIILTLIAVLMIKDLDFKTDDVSTTAPLSNKELLFLIDSLDDK